MNSKTKVTLTITAMLMVTLIAVVSIIAVFAARTQNFTSSISVTYTSREVVGTAQAAWFKCGASDSEMEYMTNGEGETVIDFSQPLSDPTLSPNEIITLNEPNESVVFMYIFTNESTRPCSLNLTYQDDETSDENVKVSTMVSSNGAALSLFQRALLLNSGFGYIITENFTNTIDTIVLPNSSLGIAILVEIDNIGADASFSGNFNFTLDGSDTAPYDETLTYYTNGDSATITGVAKGEYDDENDIFILPDSEFAIPKQYNNLPVKTVGAFAFNGQTNLTTITDFGSVENIGTCAFQETALSGQLIIPDSVTKIEFAAFAGRSDISSVKIGAGVKKIGPWAFGDCSNLSEVIIDSQEVCNNLIEWESGLSTGGSSLPGPGLIRAATIKAKYDVVGLEDEGFTKAAQKDGDYFVYTKN